MADELPHVDLGLDDEGRPVVLLGTQGDRAADMASLLAKAPGLASPAHATDLARAANHLSQGSAFRVIVDPAAFEAAYRARLAKEDPHAPWREGVMRLRDYGVPDFGAIHPPRFENGTLVFFASDSYSGVPYQVDVADLRAEPAYHVLPLTPLADAPAAPAGPPTGAGPEHLGVLVPLSAEELVARRTVMPGDLPD